MTDQMPYDQKMMMEAIGFAAQILTPQTDNLMTLARLPELRGRDLACYCKPGCPCHADVLMEFANV